MNLETILSRLTNRPLLMDRGYARNLFSSLAGRLNIASITDTQGEVALGEKVRMKALAGFGGEDPDRYRPYRLVDGIAILPVMGSLLHRFPWVASWATGYDALVRMAELAVQDPEVDGMLMDIDSAGGEVSGCFDATVQLRALGQQKPLVALCNDMNLSGAMCLASAAEHRFITSTGEAGSVGVVMAHWSYEDMLKADGVAVTLIYSGDQKVDGNPYQNLPDDVYNRFKNEVHSLRQEFAAIVGGHLGMDVDAVLATEAATYRGEAAIDVGFADELINSHDAISAFRNYLSPGDGPLTTGANMSNDKGKPASKAGHGAASPAGEEGNGGNPAAGTETSNQAIAADERARIKGITACEAATGRESLANHLAFDTQLSVEDAVNILAASPMAAAVDETSDGAAALERAMVPHANSGVEPDPGGAGGNTEEDEPAAMGSRIAGNYNRMMGRGK